MCSRLYSRCSTIIIHLKCLTIFRGSYYAQFHRWGDWGRRIQEICPRPYRQISGKAGFERGWCSFGIYAFSHYAIIIIIFPSSRDFGVYQFASLWSIIYLKRAKVIWRKKSSTVFSSLLSSLEDITGQKAPPVILQQRRCTRNWMCPYYFEHSLRYKADWLKIYWEQETSYRFTNRKNKSLKVLM